MCDDQCNLAGGRVRPNPTFGQFGISRQAIMLSDLVPILGIIFAVGLPLSIPIVYIALNYRKRKRLMELSHAERMAAIERGMEVPPLPLELIDGQQPQAPQLATAGAGVVLHRPGHGGRLSADLGATMTCRWCSAWCRWVSVWPISSITRVEGRHVEARQLEQEPARACRAQRSIFARALQPL